MAIDPRMLRNFLEICQHGSISAAARHLGIAQPSLSVSVAQLEKAVGCPLFTRSRRGIVLTDAGAALRQRAEMMDIVLRDAESAMALVRRGATGPLRIGGTPGALVSLAPAAVTRMAATGPADVQIVERPDAQLNAMLLRWEIDLALVTTGVEPPPAGIAERSVARDPFALIVGRAHAALGPTVALADLSAARWVLPRAAGAFHRQIEAMFLSVELPFPTDVIRCDSLLTSKEIVRQSDRVTILPRGVVAPELVMGVLRALPISDARIVRNIGVRVATGHPLSPLGEAFCSALEEALSDSHGL